MTNAQPAETAGNQALPSLARLVAEVVDAGRCVACGACLGICPHLIFMDGRVAAPDACGLTDGRCYDLCPQTDEPGPAEKRQKVFEAGGLTSEGPIGPVRAVHWAKAVDPTVSGRAQYGGVVSALSAYALESGLVGEAVLTSAGERGAPQGVRVKDAAGVAACATSIYAGAGTLQALNQALAEDAEHKLLVVGLPCQALGAASMAGHAKYPAGGERVAMVIGLFCTLNLDARELRAMLEEAGVNGPVVKSDFPPPPAGVFQVTTAQGTVEIPLERVYAAVLHGCSLCPDLTAEAADLSVGAAEGREGLNTIIVRTARGEEFLNAAKKAGVLELLEAEAESLEHLRGAAAGKRQRAEAAWKEADNG